MCKRTVIPDHWLPTTSKFRSRHPSRLDALIQSFFVGSIPASRFYIMRLHHPSLLYTFMIRRKIVAATMVATTPGSEKRTDPVVQAQPEILLFKSSHIEAMLPPLRLSHTFFSTVTPQSFPPISPKEKKRGRSARWPRAHATGCGGQQAARPEDQWGRPSDVERPQ